jgi:SAM-dependent methyltransferase
MPTTIANVEMANAWDGEEGDHWTEYADRYDTAGRRLWQRFLSAGLIAEADRVLDVGCGTGESSRDAARVATAGSVLGVDLSARMLALAGERSRAEGLTNVEYVQADAQVHRFDQRAFDAAISRFGAMFFADPAAAFRNIGSALRADGRLALLAWQGLMDNEWLMEIREALAAGRTLPAPPAGTPGPFGLADPDGVHRILDQAGFTDIELTALDEQICFGSDAEDAWSYVGNLGIVKGLSHDLDDATKSQALDQLKQLVAAHETADGVLLNCAAWLITARRAS